MSIRRSLAWAFSGQFIAFFVQFIGMVVISRLLAPREIGIYTIAMAALGIIQVFTTFGIASFVVREAEMPRTTLESAFTVNAILIISLSLLLMGLSFAAGPVLGATEAGSVLRILSVSNLFAIVNFRPAAMLQREMLFKPLSMIMVVNVTTQTTATIFFAVAGLSYMSAAYASLLSALVSTFMTQKLGRSYISFRMSLVGWRPITAFGLQMMSVSGVAMLNGKLSDLLVGRLLGVTALGFYGRASQLSSIIFDNLYGTATRVVFVQMSKEYRDGGDWSETYRRGFSMITAFMWPFLIGLAILARPAVHLLYGEQWLPVALPLAAMMIFQLIGVAFGMNWELFVLRGETGKQARFEGARFLLGIPIFAVGCMFNILWAAIAKIPDAVIGLVLYYPHVRRLAQLDARAIPLIYRDGALLTLVAVLPATIIMMAYRWSPTTPLPAVFGAVFVGIAFWLSAIVLMGHPLREELRIIIRKLRPGRPVS